MVSSELLESILPTTGIETAREEKDMTAEHFEETIDALMALRPFKPFIIELNTKQRLEVDHLGALLWNGRDASIFRAPGGPLVIFDHESVNNVINSPAHSAPGKRRK
jgi:hypothetical protein